MSEIVAFKDLSFGTKLTLRYLLALTLIAGMVVFSYFLLTHRLNLNDKDAYIISLSSKQRMFSQRIALAARELENAASPADAAFYAEMMEDALNQMTVSHAILTGRTPIKDGGYARMSDAMQAMYFSEDGIDPRMEEYAALGRQFLNIYYNEGAEALRENSLGQDLVEIAQNSLLQELDRAVLQYQREAEEGFIKIESTGKLVIAALLCVLFLEAALIFHPMVKSVVKTTRNLSDANQELVEFSYRISHDLRAPVISALGLGEMAQKLLEDGEIETARKSLEHSNTSLRNMDKVIEDVITLTKIKSVEQPDETIDLEGLIKSSLEKISHMPRYGDLDVSIDVQFDGLVCTKVHALRQILENIFSNAVKYADETIEHSYIQIEARKNGHICELSIRDNGLGIDEKYRDKLFQMFQRFHPKVSFGSGLGLYIALQNVKVLGGEIEYAPLDKGSLFTVRFPV